ncbi:MAG TPA: Mur ligase domain-containing protein, partial [Bacilli bacterium]|nr:Mur ligase domain-containing protein [Bacilli bacterium]
MKKKYFFVGIKGSGMSALAQVLADFGHEVEGSDVEMDFSTSHGLIERGIPVYPFNEQNIRGDSHYIISTAYDELHPE